MRVRHPSLKGTGVVFIIAAIGYAAAIANLLYIVHAPNVSLTSSALVEVLLEFVVPGLVAAICAVVLFTFPNPRRQTLVILLITCLAACVAILLRSSGLSVLVLAPPTVLLAFCLRRAHA